ncbi:Kinetochore protein Mis14 like [Nakaseomyces glabratus]
MNYGTGKVALSVGQLRSVYGQLHSILEERMSLVMPGDGDAEGDEDMVRREVQLRLQEYLLRVMEMAGDSIEVTDADPEKSIRELIMESRQKYMEPFDLDLNERVREQYHKWEDANVKIAQLRRRGPETVRSMYLEEQEKYLNEVDKRIDALEDTDQEPSEDTTQEYVPEVMSEEDRQLFQEALKSVLDTQARIPEIRGELASNNNLLNYLDKT